MTTDLLGEQLPPNFLAAFMRDLRERGRTSASETRLRWGIPGSLRIGSIVRGLSRNGIIQPVDYREALTPESCCHLERVWALVPIDSRRRRGKRRKNGGA